MSRPRRYNLPPPDDAESISGDGIIELYPTDDRSQGPPLEPVQFMPTPTGPLIGPRTVLTSADDYAPGSIWYDFKWSVSPEARARHEQIKAKALEKPECQPHGAAILDLWSGRAWTSADEFVAAVAGATGLDARRAAREARKVLRAYFLLCDELS